ncbi:MAG: helix-turn-helix transcriptional regulator [Sphingobium sp.]|jgi:transcriptional regulator with XRE-family HTH domain
MARVAGHSDQDEVLAALGQAVRGRRRELALSQEALADAAKIDRSHMGRIERGERNVTMLNMIRIAKALDMPLSKLIAKAGL